MQDDIPAEGAWAPLEMGNLFYRWYYPDKEASNNEIIVLVHGFSTPHFVWDEMKEFFTNAGYTLLVYDVLCIDSLELSWAPVPAVASARASHLAFRR